VVLLWFVAVRQVVSLGPSATGDSLAGEFVKRLAGEFLARALHADPVGLATGDVDGGDAALALHLEGRLVAFAARSKGGDETGHGGASGRYDRLRDQAFEYAWMLSQVKIEE